MGLDSVELVIAYEEAFGISIPDAVASEMRTPRDVIDCVTTKLRSSQRPPCLTQQAFHKMREAFISEMSIPRRAFRPRAQFNEIIPRAGRKAIWKRLRSDLGAIKLFDLARPAWLGALLWGMALTALFLPSLYLSKGLLEFITYIGYGFILAVAVGAIGMYLTRPFMYTFPSRYAYVGDMVRHASTVSANACMRPNEGWTRDQVAEVVRHLTLVEVGIYEREYREDARFVEDFKID